MGFSTSGKRLFVVLGMHRGGTSAVTRGLQALNVDLGDHLMPATDFNKKGYWEDLDVHRLNVSLLTHLRQDWDSLEPLDGLASRTLFPFRRQARRLLEAKLATNPLFGLKDPRMARLLPFWKSVFAAMGLEVGYVVAIRHPLSVAASLYFRDGFDMAKSCRLWLAHMLASLVESEGRHRLVVDYDLLLEKPEQQVLRIAKALDLPVEQTAMADYAEQFLAADLRHSHFGQDDLHAASGLPPRVIALYSLLLRMARDEVAVDSVEALHSCRYWRHELEKSDGTGLAWVDGGAADMGQFQLLSLRALQVLFRGMKPSPHS